MEDVAGLSDELTGQTQVFLGLCLYHSRPDKSSPLPWPGGGCGTLSKRVNEILGVLCLLKHPDKTFIGRIERGFDFLGYHFGPEGLTLAAKTIEQFVARATRLYEQEPGEPGSSSRRSTASDPKGCL